VLEIMPVAGDLLDQVRREQHPVALVIDTQRFGPHSKGDDTREPELIQRLRLEFDPLKIHGRRLSDEEKEAIEKGVNQEINAAFEQASRDPFPA